MKRLSRLGLLVTAIIVTLLPGCDLFGRDRPVGPSAGVSGLDAASPITVVSGNLYGRGSDYVQGVIKVRNDSSEALGFIQGIYFFFNAEGNILVYEDTFVQGSTMMTSGSNPTYTGTCLRPGETGYLTIIDHTEGYFSVADIRRIAVAFGWSTATFVEPALRVIQTSGPTIGSAEISGTVRNEASDPVEMMLSTVISWNASGDFTDWSFVEFDDDTTSSVNEAIIAGGASAEWSEEPIGGINTAVGAVLKLDWDPSSGSAGIARSMTASDPHARLLALREARDARNAELAARVGDP